MTPSASSDALEAVVTGRVNVDLLAQDNVTRDLLVSIFVNRQPKLIKNFPPYTLELNTADYLNPSTGRGTVSTMYHGSMAPRARAACCQ